MMKPDPLLFSLQKMVVDLALIDRNHYLAGTERRENDIEHSLSVALLCWFIHDRYKLKLDIGKILKYAIAHDFVELYAGDVNTFADEESRKTKIQVEKEALDRMSGEFSKFGDMVHSMHAYETMDDEEALFVWTVDKMQALIMGDLDNWRPYEEIEIDYARLTEKTSEQLGKASLHCKEIFAGLIEYSKLTYYDRPKAETDGRKLDFDGKALVLSPEANARYTKMAAELDAEKKSGIAMVFETADDFKKDL